MASLQLRHAHGLLRIAGAAVLAVATVACSGGAAPSVSTAPSPSAPATSDPPASGPPASPSPATPSATPDPSLPSGDPRDPASPVPSQPVIPRDSIATVVTDDLRVRSKPGISDDSVLLEPLLDRDREVLVVDGPVEASGYTWYLVAPIGGLDRGHLPVGWVAMADKNGEAWLQPRDAECPEKPTTIAQLSILEPLIALACFGADEIEVTAQAIRPEATCGVDVGWTIEPDWLASTCPQPMFILTGQGAERDLSTVIEPGTPIGNIDPGVVREDAVDVVVRGHFDHEASDSCRVVVYEADAGPQPDVTPEEAIVICRSQFVITSLEAAAV